MESQVLKHSKYSFFFNGITLNSRRNIRWWCRDCDLEVLVLDRQHAFFFRHKCKKSLRCNRLPQSSLFYTYIGKHFRINPWSVLWYGTNAIYHFDVSLSLKVPFPKTRDCLESPWFDLWCPRKVFFSLLHLILSFSTDMTNYKTNGNDFKYHAPISLAAL